MKSGKLNSATGNLARNACIIVCMCFIAACTNSSKTPEAVNDQYLATDGLSETAIPTSRVSLSVIDSSKDGAKVVGNGYSNPILAPSAGGKVISNQTKFSSAAFGVQGSPRVSTGVAVRKGGGRYHVGKPYTIRGVRYVPREDPNYRAVGLASWYGPNFHGRLTANGEVYDQFALSAAHPTMPLPSYARVTNLENGSSLVVRVNDRGPFSSGRIIDLSSQAAHMLGYTKKGVAKVKVEYVGKARMDGLDREQLMATYDPGSLPMPSGRQIIAAKKQASKPVVQASAAPAAEKGTKTTALSAFQPGKFVKDRPTVDVSALQPPTELSQVNGYQSFALQNSKAALAIENQLSNDFNMPEDGMDSLSRIRIDGIADIKTLEQISSGLSRYGPVSVLKHNGSFFLEATIANEDMDAVRSFIAAER